MPADALRAQLETALTELPAGALVVGFSGGADSSALLHALAHMPAARARGLRAIHVDHALHADSAAWSDQCRRLAAQLDVAIEVQRVAVAGVGGGREDAARAARLAAFAQHLDQGDILALAHHRDDQAETVLLKLLRGAGPEGLGGMRALRAFGNGLLWRPLLELPRTEILAYVRRHALPWLDDPSNADTSLRRNFLRAQVLPLLQTRWPDAPVALAHSATWARDAAAFIAVEARKALARVQGLDPTTLHWRGWLALPAALRDPVLRVWLRELQQDEPTHVHVAELARQLHGASADRLPCINFGRTELRRYRDLLYAVPRLSPLPSGWEISWDARSPLLLPDGSRLRNEAQAALTAPLRVRYRGGGERIKPAGGAHTRELRLLLQEAGVPPWQRERLPLVWRDGELLAVADLIASDAALALGLRLRLDLGPRA